MAKKKRGNGEGSIYRRKNGGWATQYTIYTAEGRKRKTIYGKTRQEVAAKLAKALSDREGGLVYDAEGLRLGEYLDRWLVDSVRDTVRLTTYQGYERICRLHLKPFLGQVRLKDLSVVHVRGLYRERLEAKLAPRMVQLIHVTLHKALKQAVTDGLIPRNVTEAVKPPQPEKKEIRPLSPNQARALLEEVKGDRLESLYVLAVSTGMRQGELLGLKWEDVDLGHGQYRSDVPYLRRQEKGSPLTHRRRPRGDDPLSSRKLRRSPCASTLTLSVRRGRLLRDCGKRAD